MKLSHLIPLIVLSLIASLQADAKPNLPGMVQKTAEAQVRNLVDPLLEKYCRDECKLMSVQVSVDVETPDGISPGFDEIDANSGSGLAPSSGRVKLLIDDKVGPVSRGQLIELLQQYLDTLDFPVKIETQITRFPQPIGSASKITELREKLAKQFKQTIEDLFQQFCPQQCLLADFNLQTEAVNTEEAQYGNPGEFIQDGGIAIRIKDISATLLIDETLSPEEQNNILEMAKLKTNGFRHVSLATKSMKFPRPLRDSSGKLINGASYDANGVLRGPASDTKTNNEKKELFNTRSDTQSKNSQTSTDSRTSNNQNSSTTSSNENKNSTNTTNESNQRQERFERFEKIERVENGDAVQAELQKFKVFGLIFACSILSMLIFIVFAIYGKKMGGSLSSVQRLFQGMTSDPINSLPPSLPRSESGGESASPGRDERMALISKRFEIERIKEELLTVYAHHPKVAKQVFTRVLTEEGVEVTAQYIHLFGETIVMDMLRDPSLQSDMTELMEFYTKNTIELTDDETLDLLRRLHNRTVAGKLIVMGNRSSSLFDFLAEMDGMQILELIRNESLTVKSIVLTQCDPQKRSAIYAQLDDDTRMRILGELSRIDYLPRDYIFNVANALKRKKKENPRLNTEALPGSEVLVNLLERTGPELQRTVVKNLEMTNPDNARNVKSKLVSIDTLRFLRDGQLLEVVLSLKHDELLIFLKGAPPEVREAVFSKSPKELIAELEEELMNVKNLTREGYQAVERKVLNRMKLMANEGLINLIETNERMFSQVSENSAYIQGNTQSINVQSMRRGA